MKINFVAPINPTSYGLCGLNLLREFVRAGVDTAYLPIGEPQVLNEHADLIKGVHFQMRSPSYWRDAPSLRLWHAHNLAEHVGRGPHIGMTIHELDRCQPFEQRQMANLDMVLTTSQYHVRIFQQYTTSPVRYVPLGVDRTIFHEGVAPLYPKDNLTTFLMAGKAEYRKGIDIVYEAFNRAFTPKDNVQLVLLAHNPFIGDEGNKGWHDYFKGGPLGDKVVYHKRLPTQGQVASLMRYTDVLLAPSRAEGFNLEVLEMAAVGGQAIVSNCTAHSDFAPNADFSMIPMPDEPTELAVDGTPFFTGQGNWFEFGESQLEFLVEEMRAYHRQRQQEGPFPPNLGGVALSKRLSWENSARTILTHLSQL
jgi:glycosyltransferase involved in cell wall biosynthesis